LLVHLQRLYESPGVRVEVLGDKVRLSLEKAIPLGLVLNELFTNALKYAFPEREGLLACEIRRRDGRVEVKVADDGVGLPQGFDPQTTNTLGFKLVRNLVQLQLGGEMKIDGKAGAAVSISFRIDHGENP
jgi:two-component sensor histidine kinase